MFFVKFVNSLKLQIPSKSTISLFLIKSKIGKFLKFHYFIPLTWTIAWTMTTECCVIFIKNLPILDFIRKSEIIDFDKICNFKELMNLTKNHKYSKLQNIEKSQKLTKSVICKTTILLQFDHL